jgi:hypothetical protein
MKRELGCVLMSGAILLGCQKKEPPVTTPPPKAEIPQNNSSGNPVTAPVDYLGAVAKSQQSAVKTIDIAQISQAVQMFQAAEGRYPADLDELVRERYLQKIPAAPYGMKIDYDASKGQVRVVKQQP